MLSMKVRWIWGLCFSLLLGAAQLRAVEIQSVEPYHVSMTDPTLIHVHGSGFAQGMVLKFQGVAVEFVWQEVVDSTALRALAPALPPGSYDLAVADSGGTVLAALPSAIFSAPACTVARMLPGIVSALEPTPVLVVGEGFIDATEISSPVAEEIVIWLQDKQVLSSSLMIGTVPALPFTITEPLDVRVVGYDSRGSSLLDRGLRFVPEPATVIEEARPALVSTLGGTRVTFAGRGFSSLQGMALATPEMLQAPAGPTWHALQNPTFDGGTGTLSGITPPLDPGFHDALLIVGAKPPRVVAYLHHAVEAAPLPQVTSVEPAEIPATGGVPVSIHGRNFLPSTSVRLGNHALLEPQFASQTLITGFAPPLLPRENPGLRDVTAADSRGTTVLSGGVVYVQRQYSLLAAPLQTEGAIGEGWIRLAWHNPVSYDEIRVYDEDLARVTTLPGDKDRLYLPSNGRKQARYFIQGMTKDEKYSGYSGIEAVVPECGRQHPVTPRSLEGPADLTLYGGHGTFAGNPCGGGEVSCSWSDALCIEVDEPFWQEARIGRLNWSKDSDDPEGLVTGFTLESQAIKLEISAYYQQIATHPGGSLRGRISLVRPFDLGEPLFEDEFQFPLVVPGRPKEWNRAVYARQCVAGQTVEVLPLPPGDYRLELYAAGGDNVPYYVFGSEWRDIPILIPGVPCPPYPAIEIVDVTGLDTLPEIYRVDCTWAEEVPFAGGKTIYAALTAVGKWNDGLGEDHPIPPRETRPDDFNPGFEYEWRIQDQPPVPWPVITGYHSVNARLNDWKCYYTNITIWDRACGFKREYLAQFAATPVNLQCTSLHNSFLLPAPDPGGIHGIIGLNVNPPPGNGRFQGARPLEFKVLVAPSCSQECGGPGSPCSAPVERDLRFRLSYTVNNIPVTLAVSNPDAPDALIQVEDACEGVAEGAKYFRVRINDLGRLPAGLIVQPGDFKNVYFQGATVRWQGQSIPEASWDWQTIGTHLHLANPPSCLASSIWTGYLDEEDASYHFVVRTSQNGQTDFADDGMRKTREIPLPIEAQDVSIPSCENRLGVGLDVRFRMANGGWSADTATGMVSGSILSNKLSGKALEIAPLGIAGDGAGAQLFGPYEWCAHEPILQDSIRQTLLETLIYAGTIGPVPVEFWGTVELGIDYRVDAYMSATVSPFAPLTGGHFVDTHYYLMSNTRIFMPCGVRADVLFGVFSVSARLVPGALFQLDTHVGYGPSGATWDRYIRAEMSLGFEAKACLDLVLYEECWGKSVTLLDRTPLIPNNPDGPVLSPRACGAGGALASPEDDLTGTSPDGRGAGLRELEWVEDSPPSIAISPDGETVLSAYMSLFAGSTEGRLSVDFNKAPAQYSPTVAPIRKGRDPSAAFLSSTRALVAFTETQQSPVYTPVDPANPTLAERNDLARRQEIRIHTFELEGATWWAESAFYLQDTLDVPISARRADGRASVAAASAASPPEALVAWVRCDTPAFLVDDGRKQMLQPQPVAGGLHRIVLTDVQYIRPKLEQTAIYARRVGFDGPSGEPPAKLSPQGINIEPCVATTPLGQTAYCVWVNDSSIDRLTGEPHKNLTDSNAGRRLLCSVYTRSQGIWGPWADAVGSPHRFPGLLEPYIDIWPDEGGRIDGVLAFTALDEGVADRDTGLVGTGRSIYVSYLDDGVFGEPFRLHEKCGRLYTGHWIKLTPTRRDERAAGHEFDPTTNSYHQMPDLVMTWQGTGPIGLPSGSGDVMVAVLPHGGTEGAKLRSLTPEDRAAVLSRSSTGWTKPHCLTPEDRIVSSVAMAVNGSKLCTMHLDSGPALIGAGEEPAAYKLLETQLKPDLALAGCLVSDPYAPPGAVFAATMEVENRGLAGSAVDEAGESVVRLKIVVSGHDGTEELFFDVPEIGPGESTKIVIDDAEMLLDPTAVLVTLDPNPGDADPSNDSCEIFLGVPAPEDVTCQPIWIQDEDRRLAARITWKNPVGYDAIYIYREGLLASTLPGSSTLFVDHYAEPGEPTYEVRGRIRSGKSLRSAALCVLPPEPPETMFRRGDGDAGGVVNITDAIFVLGYLFLGTRAPPCPDAADADDNGKLEITDPIRTLGFLFLGSAAPPAPGPRSCGPDPKPDDLGPCRYECR